MALGSNERALRVRAHDYRAVNEFVVREVFPKDQLLQSSSRSSRSTGWGGSRRQTL